MTITAREVDLLNRMNSTAVAVQLGTLVQNAESVTAGEIALAEGKILVGNSSGVAAAATLTSTQVLVGSSADVATARTVTGDVTIGNTGVTAIGAGKVTNTMLSSGNIYTHRVFAAGKFTTAGGDATETITIASGAATDIVLVNVQTKGGTPRTIVEAIPGTGNVVVTLSGDPSTDHILAWVSYRAVS